MKKILLGLIIGGGIFGKTDHILSLNGSFGSVVKYVDINKDNVLGYPKDFSYIMELSSIGKLDKNDIGGILNFGYDNLGKIDIENVYISLDSPSSKLEVGDVLLDISDFTISNNSIRGIKGNFPDKNTLFYFGISKEKIDVGSETSGQYRQWLGAVRVSSVARNNTWGITYVVAEDDSSSVNLPTGKPMINKVFGGDIIIPLARDLSFKSNLAFSEYDEDKRNSEGLYKNKAFLGGFDLNFNKLSFEGIYQYIEPIFYTAGNTGLDTDWEGIKLNTKYIPSDKPFTTEINFSLYDDNPDEKETNVTKTNTFQIKSDITPKSFPSLSIDYKNTRERDNARSPSKIANEFSLGVSKAIKDIDISVDYNRSSSDDKKSDEYDSLLSSYSLNTGGALTKKIFLSSSISFITSNTGVGINKTKQDSNYYLLSLSFQPTQSLRISPSYDYSKTKDNKEGIILKENLASLSFDYYLSTKYQLNMEYKNIDHKEKDNNYKADSVGIKMTCLF